MSSSSTPQIRWLVALLLILATCTASQFSYDFIVVGAGIGGCTVVRRILEANETFTILLIESGGLPKEGSDVPARVFESVTDSNLLFHYLSTPQTHSSLRFNGFCTSVDIRTGKGLGGGSSLNMMWMNRGNKKDYWSDVSDDWGYDSLLKYFKRSENYQGDFPSDQHGTGGPITVSRPRYSPGLENFWLEAGKELGYPVGDPNGPQQSGFFPVEYSQERGRRVSAYSGYLTPVLNMRNLHIITNTNVTQIIFEGTRAVGVRYNSSTVNSSCIAFATKEVILSAGTIVSPAILQRSGIGPLNVLQPAGIPVLKELPTGKNFHDHPALNLNYAVNNGSTSVLFNETRDLNPDSLAYYEATGDGPYSTTRAATGQAFLVSSFARAEGAEDWPDIQLCMSHSVIPYFSADGLFGSAEEHLLLGESPISISVFVARPKSRGTVRINPDNVFGDPLIDVGYLKDPRDVQIMLEGIGEAVRIYETTNAYSLLTPRYTPTDVPACAQFKLKSDEYWKCYIGQVTVSGGHHVGTNKMGKSSDHTAVVDAELRVIGIDGLRIVDASVIPAITNANIQWTVYAIAEKAADMILEKWTS